MMRAVFPALCAMRYCDANVPAMDKIYYLVKRVDYALLSSQPMLNDEELFGPLYRATCEGVINELLGEVGEKEFLFEDETRLVNDICFVFFHWLIMFSIDSFDGEDTISLGQGIQDSWTKRKSQLEHNWMRAFCSA